MKNKLLIIIIGAVFITIGVISFVLKSDSSTNDKTSSSTEDKEEIKELRKISEEEISDEIAQEIIQFYLDKASSNEKIKILTAKILASNENGKYLVRLEIENNSKDTKDTSIQYLRDGKWQVELPLKNPGIIGDEYTEFWGVEEE